MTQAKIEETPVRRKSPRRDPKQETHAEPPTVGEPAAIAEGAVAEESAPSEPVGRDRIQQQLEVLKQREAELRRELAMADHPELADAIRSIEGRAYGVSRVEAKMAEGLSKSELRRKETLEKKLTTARERRAEVDAQITALELELTPLGDARLSAFGAERTQALMSLIALLDAQEPALTRASLDVAVLVPALSSWRAEMDGLRATSRS